MSQSFNCCTKCGNLTDVAEVGISDVCTECSTQSESWFSIVTAFVKNILNIKK